MSLHRSGSEEGNTRLKDRNPPATMDMYACTSNTVYKVEPGTAGFFDLVDERGAKVAAVFFTA